jgi:hypothetical protein
MPSTKNNKIDKLLITAILAGASILSLGILASQRAIKTHQKNIETKTINNGNLLLEYSNLNLNSKSNNNNNKLINRIKLL